MDYKNSYRGCRNQSDNPNDAVPQFCKDCTQYASCDLYQDEQLRERCSLLQEDIPLFYRNSEGYADPTSFFALRNVERERKAKKKAMRTSTEFDPKESTQAHCRTHVVHY